MDISHPQFNFHDIKHHILIINNAQSHFILYYLFAVDISLNNFQFFFLYSVKHYVNSSRIFLIQNSLPLNAIKSK